MTMVYSTSRLEVLDPDLCPVLAQHVLDMIDTFPLPTSTRTARPTTDKVSHIRSVGFYVFGCRSP